jgi:hypothetical protein
MLRGSLTALVTPFDNGGAFDEKAFQAFVEWQIAEGTSGLVPVGTTGESPTLSHEEHHRVVKACIEVAKGRVPVVAGAGSNNTAEAISLVEHAEKSGADAVLVVTPYYNKPTQRGLYAHFAAVAKATSLPIIIYNIPPRSVVDMTPETMGRLAHDFKNIVGVKDATGKVERVSEQRITCGKDFIQLSGRGCFRARLQCPWRRRLHLRDLQCRAAALRRIPGGDIGQRQGPRARIAGPPDALAQGDLHRAGSGRLEIRAVEAGQGGKQRALAVDHRRSVDRREDRRRHEARGIDQLGG